MTVSFNKRINLARLGLSEKQLARLLPETVEEMLKDAARKTATLLRRIARRKDIKFTGRYIAGWKAIRRGERLWLVTNDVPYARFAELGRGPGKPPPVAALKPWAAAKLGNANLAYPIAKNIAKRGTVARNRYVSTSAEYREGVKKVIAEAARRVVGAALKRAYR